MSFFVVAEFNTDENNKWVYDDCVRYGDPLPISVFGPFEIEDEANKYCDDFMPDDTDVYDVWVTSILEPTWETINDPKEYNHYGYKLLVEDDESPISVVVRGESTHCNEKKSVA